MNPLHHFLCQHFNVNDVYDIVWYPSDTVRTSETGRMLSVNLNMETTSRVCVKDVPLKDEGPIPARFQPKRPYRGRPVDLSRVAVQSILIKGYSNPNECHLGLKTNVMPKSLAYDMHVYDQTKAAAYNRKELAGLRMDLQPKTNIPQLTDQNRSYLMREHPDLIEMNPAWAKAVGHLHPSNLSNYIVSIPREVCIAQTEWAQKHITNEKQRHNASLPVWMRQQDDQEPTETCIHHWYALPPDHILAAYCYAPKAVLKQRFIDCHMIRCRRGNLPPKSFIVITDVALKGLRQVILEQWLPRLDTRCLMDVGIEAIPLRANDAIEQPIRLNTNITYIAWSAYTPEEIQKMIPTCNAALVTFLYRDIYKDHKQKQMIKSILPNK